MIPLIAFSRRLLHLPFVSLVAFGTAAGALRAETVQFPKEAPIASFELPAGWTYGPRKDGSYGCLSADHKLLLIFKRAKRIAPINKTPSSKSEIDEVGAFVLKEATDLAKAWNITATHTPYHNVFEFNKGELICVECTIEGKMKGEEGCASVRQHVFVQSGEGFLIEMPYLFSDAASPENKDGLNVLETSIKAANAGFDSFDAPAPSPAPPAPGASSAAGGSTRFGNQGQPFTFTLPPGWVLDPPLMDHGEEVSVNIKVPDPYMTVELLGGKLGKASVGTQKLVQKYAHDCTFEGTQVVPVPEVTNPNGVKFTTYAIAGLENKKPMSLMAMNLVSPKGAQTFLVIIGPADMLQTHPEIKAFLLSFKADE